MLKIFFLLFYSLIPGFNVIQNHSDSERSDCLDCHDKILKNSVIHPAAENSCADCHESLGSGHPVSGVKGFRLSISIPGLCYKCHTDLKESIDTSSVIHGPLKGAASCTNCHLSHSSPVEKLLKAETNALCLGCHNKVIVTESKVKLDNINNLIKLAESVHPAISDGTCTTCHNPHRGERSYMLNASFPEGFYANSIPESFEICFLCHDTELITASETSTSTNFRQGNRNLHYAHINGTKGHSCRACHNVHASENPFLIESSIRFGNWTMNLNYIRTDSGGSCATGCHGLKDYKRVNIN